MTVVRVSYFSDVLCILAYAAQARIDGIKVKFGSPPPGRLPPVTAIERLGLRGNSPEQREHHED